MSSTAHIRLAAGLACGLACGSATRPALEPVAATRSPERRQPAETPARPPPPTAPLEPELQALLTEAYRPPRPPPEPGEARSRCHPERPDTPYERSLCACEATCARTIDRQRLARRMLEDTADPEAVARWLREGTPATLHYPYTETDGTRIDVDGDGRVTRCRHSRTGDPGVTVDLECASLDRR